TVRAMASFCCAAEPPHPAAAIELELNARMRHVVVVDRKPGAGQIRRAGDADPAAARELAERILPVGGTCHPADALGEADVADPQVVRGERVRLLDDSHAQ